MQTKVRSFVFFLVSSWRYYVVFVVVLFSFLFVFYIVKIITRPISIKESIDLNQPVQPASAAAGIVLSLPNITVNTLGSIITVPVILQSNQYPVIGIDYRIEFSPSIVELVDITTPTQTPLNRLYPLSSNQTFAKQSVISSANSTGIIQLHQTVNDPSSNYLISSSNGDIVLQLIFRSRQYGVSNLNFIAQPNQANDTNVALLYRSGLKPCLPNCPSNLIPKDELDIATNGKIIVQTTTSPQPTATKTLVPSPSTSVSLAPLPPTSYPTPIGTISPAQCVQTRNIVLYPSEDTKVSSHEPNRNFGTSDILVIKNQQNYPLGTFYSFMKYNLSLQSIQPLKIKKAELKFFVTGGIFSNNLTLEMYEVNPNSWGETTTNWLNRPSFGRLIQNINIKPLWSWYSIDVTSFVRSSPAIFSLGFKIPESYTQGERLFIATKEWQRTTERLHPYLVIEVCQ